MATPQSTFQRAFSAGELTPALHARADQVKYITGLRRCRNFIVQRHGGVTNRAGTRFTGACKTTSINVKLMRYVSEVVGESVLWEIGNGYFRPYVNGARLQVAIGTVGAYGGATPYVIGDLVTSGGIIYYSLAKQTGVAPPGASWHPFVGEFYELPSAFGVDLPNWNQSGRVITLTKKGKAPYELINGGGLTVWILRPIVDAITTPAPVGLAVVPGGGAGALTIGYVVTAAAAGTLEESIASGQVINVSLNKPTNAAPDKLSWTAVAGAAEYYIYADYFGAGVYGFIGTAASNAFINPGIDPNYSLTPPIVRTLFAAAGDYPDRSGTFEQRRIFGYTNNLPDGVFGSRIGFLSNFSISQPLQDDDAITFRIAGNNHNPVKHILDLTQLVLMTGGGGWVIGQPGVPLTPSALGARQHSYTGCGEPVPVIVGNSIIYIEKLGAKPFDLQFDLQVEGLGGRDLGIFSDHLFKGFTIAEIDFQQNPDSIVWCCRSDGTLLGLTYIREQEVAGWHRHDSTAACRFEHVCVVPEAAGDTVYVITRRTISGGFVRYIEKLERRLVQNFDPDAFFVDCGLTYIGAPVNNVSGLGQLEGQVVAVVGDGSVIFNGDPAAANAANFTVTGGTLPVVLPASYATIHVGLQITAQLEALDLDVQGSDVRAKKKRVGALNLLLESSCRSFYAGPDTANLMRLKLEPFETPTDEFTGLVELNLTSAFGDNGRVFLQHTDPLPLTILGWMPNTELGG